MAWTVVNSREPRELELLYRLSQTLGGSLELRDALKSARGNIAAASRKLRTTPRITGYKIQKYGIDPNRYAG